MPMEFKHQLLEDRVAILPDPMEEKSSSGIFNPKNVNYLSDKGTVIAIGPGYTARESGVKIPMFVKVGDRVKFNITQCETFEGFLLMFESSIKCILHEDKI